MCVRTLQKKMPLNVILLWWLSVWVFWNVFACCVYMAIDVLLSHLFHNNPSNDQPQFCHFLYMSLYDYTVHKCVVIFFFSFYCCAFAHAYAQNAAQSRCHSLNPLIGLTEIIWFEFLTFLPKLFAPHFCHSCQTKTKTKTVKKKHETINSNPINWCFKETTLSWDFSIFLPFWTNNYCESKERKEKKRLMEKSSGNKEKLLAYTPVVNEWDTSIQQQCCMFGSDNWIYFSSSS